MTSPEVRIMEKIPKSSLICGKSLGQGGFGNVINATYNGKDVAVKILHSPLKPESYIEITFMFQLKHRNLTRMIGLVDVGYSDCPQLVFLKASEGNLLQYVQGIEENVLEPLKKAMLNKFATDVIHGMEYLHQMHYFHKSLAARNVLIHQFGEYQNAQVSDYGISRIIDGQGSNYYKTTEGVTLPIRWTPKECIPSANSTGNFTFASDVWAFGVVLWEAWTKGDIPYGAARSNTEVRQLILNGSSPLTFFRPECPADVMSVMESIFRDKPEDRPTFTDLQKAFHRMKPVNQRDKQTPSGEKSGAGGNTDNPQQEKKNKKQNNPQKGGDNAGRQEGGPQRPQKPKGPHPQGQNFQNPQGHFPNPRGPHFPNPQCRLPNPPGQNFQNQQRHNFPNPQGQQNFRHPNQHQPRPNMPGAPGQGKRNKGPRTGSEPPPPYTPPNQAQVPNLMAYAGAVPPYVSQPQPPPPSYSSLGTEADMTKKMMELQQKISSLEVKQLEQKLQNLQKEVEGAKSQNPKPRNPNQQHHKKNPNPNQQHKNPNQPSKNKGGPGGSNPNQNPGPASGVPSWMPAAESAIYGMAAGVAIAAAAANRQKSAEDKNKKK